jgi:hypothetical protein
VASSGELSVVSNTNPTKRRVNDEEVCHMCEPRIRYLLIASEDHSCTIAARSANTGERGRSTGVVTLKNVRRVSGLANTRSPHSRDELVVSERFKGNRE